MDSIYAVMSSQEFLELMNNELRERERIKKLKRDPASSEPEITINLSSGLEMTLEGEVQPPPIKTARNPFAGAKSSRFKLVGEDDKPPPLKETKDPVPDNK